VKTNEAAERLLARSWMTSNDFDDLIAAALAAERRATVERIRERLVETGRKERRYLGVAETRLLRILDEEAQAAPSHKAAQE
jgi:hypothetical protein